MLGKKYLFTVHEDTIWVDELGKSSWNLSGIAEHEKDKCGIIIAFGTWFGRGFEENPNNPGKYYCRKTMVKDVEIIKK
jgi:hypothetical protein